MNRHTKFALFLALPLVGVFGLIMIKRTYGLPFTIITRQYERDLHGNHKKNAIRLYTNLSCRLGHPSWWPRSGENSSVRFSFVSATIEDSNHAIIPADEIEADSYIPDTDLLFDSPWMRHTSVLRPRGVYDLSRGGHITLRLKVAPETPNAPVFWAGEVTSILSPTQMSAQ